MWSPNGPGCVGSASQSRFNAQSFWKGLLRLLPVQNSIEIGVERSTLGPPCALASSSDTGIW